MGRGDKKSRKGKIARGSYGNARPHKPAKGSVAVATTDSKVKKEAKVVAEVAGEETPAVKKTKKTTKKTKEATGEE